MCMSSNGLWIISYSMYLRTTTRIQSRISPNASEPPSLRASEMRSHAEMLGKSQPHGQVRTNQPLKSLGDDAVRPKGKVAQLGPKAVEHQAETPAWAVQPFVYLGGHHGPPHQTRNVTSRPLILSNLSPVVCHLSSRSSFSQGF
jgi:hypothetical protein